MENPVNPSEMESVSESRLEQHLFELRKYFRWNYSIHCLEGGLFIGGIAFVAPNSVLPTMVEELGGPPWLISLMPIMMMIGFFLPPLFTAHRIEDMHFVKPVLLWTGAFQRLPYLLAGVVLLGTDGTDSRIPLIMVALAPLVSGMFGGFTVTAWMELIARTIPESRRASLSALRFVMAGIIGIAAGKGIAEVLDRFPGPEGYGILHLIAFAFLFVSYVLFWMIRETNPPHDTRRNSVDLTENLRLIPLLVGSDRRLLLYLCARSLMNGIFIMTPFLAIHTLAVLEKEPGFVGYLVTSQMVGGIFGNLMAGYLGDMKGGKVPMIVSRTIFIVLCLWSCSAGKDWEFFAIFFLFGVAFYSNQVGTSTLCIEISPLEKRVTYLAVITTISLPSMLLASGMSTLLWKTTENFTFLALATTFCMFLSLVFLKQVEDPRRACSRT